MGNKIKGNERSNQFLLVDTINDYLNHREYEIKKMAGEFTVFNTDQQKHMFPDILLFSDCDLTKVLQGWELKMPETPITDPALINDAKRKAETLGLKSFVVWNFSYGGLYVKDDDSNEFKLQKIWKNQNIKTRLDVDFYRTEWIKTAKEIIDTINDYLSTNKIKTKSLLEVVTSNNLIPYIVETNYKEVANRIKDNLSYHLNEKYEIDYLLENQKDRIAFDQKNNFDSGIDLYAKNLIINFCNKILFANLLKRFYSNAKEIDNINSCNTSKDGILILKTVSEKIDFFNIFSPLKFQEDLPSNCWENLKEFNKVLSESNFREIDHLVLQKILEQSLDISQRWFAGQYVTPYSLAKVLVRLTVQDANGFIIDPCCGTGTIPRAVLEFKKNNSSNKDANDPIEKIWASDKYSFPLQMATLALADPFVRKPIKVFQENAFSLKCGNKYDFIHPGNGKKEEYLLPPFDNVISNLPFIPFESDHNNDLDATAMRHIEQRIKEETGSLFSKRSDYYFYLIFHLWDILKINGRAGFITSNSWLATEAGKSFFKILQYYYAIEQIHISGKGRWFQNSDVITVLLILTKKEIGTPNLNSTVSFVKWSDSLDKFDDDYIKKFILDVFNADQSKYFQKSTYSLTEMDSILKLGLSLNSFFEKIKWVEKIKHCLIPYKQVFSIRRGMRPGWDDMFILKEKNGIEDEFLLPMIKNSKSIKKYDMKQTDSYFFSCPLGYDDLLKKGKLGAIEWIGTFSSITNKIGKPLKEILGETNNPWYYSKNEGRGFDFVTSLNPNTRFFFSRIDNKIVINQRLIGLKNISSHPNDILHCLLNSILNFFFIESTGIGRGDGVLDLNSKNISSLSILNPELLSEEDQKEIIKKFEALKADEIKPIDVEIENPLRISFEKTVLKAFGIEAYYEDIKTAFLNMLSTRLSVNSK